MSATRLRQLSAMFAAAVATSAFVFAPATVADPNPTPNPDLGCLLPQASTYCTGGQEGPVDCRVGTIPAGIPDSTDAPGGLGSAAAPGPVAAAPPPMGAPHNTRTGRGPCAGGPLVIPGTTNAGGGPGLGLTTLPVPRPDQQPTAVTGGGGVRPGQAGQPNR